MLQNLTGWHAIIILVVILLLFGAAKLPVLAKSVGQSMKIFKTEIRESRVADAPADAPADEQSAPQPVTTVDGR
ncbi:twin-arginine translocase TatA/TatE family subunit [Cryobacterium sp. SO2]|uniref:twin-arginine translocase TatA/TatE family subunit n=1 Tax=Cryobacterium sp. SO2 TaxID=1897060 RepID=UPI00223D4004|nr:twin-arginine translocase TatA/TatE family subunit [Cryobacterium sp. SO2]WEO79402.1 twin-arginine translocase TatA/TatE family subunit [Cryobacterium sp. SO2]